MSKKPETRRQRRIQERLRKEFRGIYVRKIHGGPFTHSGMGDLLICIKGLFVVFEVKEPGNNLSEMQEIEQEEVRVAGGVYEQVEEPDEAVRFIKDLLARSARR